MGAGFEHLGIEVQTDRAKEILLENRHGSKVLSALANEEAVLHIPVAIPHLKVPFKALLGERRVIKDLHAVRINPFAHQIHVLPPAFIGIIAQNIPS